ncbi:hypothetical protein [Romboutsia sp.]|uniref:hypothetical protein n=1 Tax=Romboutsia sp. TaxID=1965302 RepID=UPI003F334213
MEVNLDKMICKVYSTQELGCLKYYKQFVVYENLQFDCRYINICKVKVTVPEIKIISTKIIKTPKGNSLEGQFLSGKKLIIIGSLAFSLILDCHIINKKFNINNKEKIEDIRIPFSTFIVIPDDETCNNKINLRYLVEDVSAIVLSSDRVFVTTSLLIQYLDEY